MLRAALYAFLLAGLSAGWLRMTGGGCVIRLDQNVACVGFIGGTVASVACALVAAQRALARWWDERRSRAWRLP